MNAEEPGSDTFDLRGEVELLKRGRTFDLLARMQAGKVTADQAADALDAHDRLWTSRFVRLLRELLR